MRAAASTDDFHYDRQSPGASRDEEIAAAVGEISVCLAQAIHRLDPEAARQMNYAAGKAYNRLIERDQHLAADILYRFGRALLDPDLFPDPS